MSLLYNAQAYRKAVKKIREIEYLKTKIVLNEDEQKKVSQELIYKEIARRNKALCFEDLPEEIVNVIVEFLPFNVRIALLKRKYNKKYIKEMLEKLPYKMSILTDLWPCAMISREILLSFLLKKTDDMYCDMKSSMKAVLLFSDSFVTEKKHKYYYQGVFVELIIKAVYHYTKIYKLRKSIPYYILNTAPRCALEAWDRIHEQKIKEVEELILKLYTHLDIMLGLKQKLK
jgi:hypothetical protein